MFISTAYAQAAGGVEGGFATLLPLVLIFVSLSLPLSPFWMAGSVLCEMYMRVFCFLAPFLLVVGASTGMHALRSRGLSSLGRLSNIKRATDRACASRCF